MSVTPEQLNFLSAGASLAGFVWRPDQPREHGGLVVMAHGLTNSHADAPLFGEFRERLLAEGLSVFMFDFFGSGESEGAFEDKTWANQRQNLADAIDFAAQELAGRGKPIALFGRSVGGTLCGFFVTDRRVRCGALASPPFRLERSFGRYRSRAIDGYVHMPPDLERSGQIRGEWKLPVEFFEELTSFERELEEAVRGARRVLVTHGLSDAKVDRTNSEELYQALAEPKRYLPIQGADHYYHGHEDQLVDEATRWITDYFEDDK